ncbi:hypothetical protein PL222_04820 [Salmonella enterica]|uniref:hypothetical protein n=1 Tax=Salmonella enterica TaxID=28901 RepID=UPI0026DD45CE|nr:hypothetical protein [Salmonella enterica]EBC0774881.1 hypothetical protein [Salmonella enterica]MDO3815002.1 hypothetical protein [Salmonella enterica]MDO3824056.1 hypothetical protein [Salmonella enterica]
MQHMMINPMPLVSALWRFVSNHRSITPEAHDALSKAIFEVEKYYRDCIKGDSPSRQREDAIAEYWRVAAVHVRPLDSHFAEICDRKVYYWLSPEQYSRQDVLDYEMSLENVKRKLIEIRS